MKADTKELSYMESLEELSVITDKLRILCNLIIMHIEGGNCNECQTLIYILLDYVLIGKEKVLYILENTI